METLTIDKKKFVVIKQNEFDKLQLLAAKKQPLQKNLRWLQEKKMPIK